MCTVIVYAWHDLQCLLYNNDCIMTVCSIDTLWVNVHDNVQTVNWLYIML